MDFQEKRTHTKDSADYLDLTQFDWLEVLPQFGVDARYLTKKHGPCPLPNCDSGGKGKSNKDRFRFDNKFAMGNYFCNSCGAGNAWKLMRGCSGLSDTEIAAKLHKILGGVSTKPVMGKPMAPVCDDLTEEEVRKNRRRLAEAWEPAVMVSKGDPVWRYLRSRVPGCDMTKLSRHIRYNPSMKFVELERAEVRGKMVDRYVTRGNFPVLLGKAIDAQEQPITLHRHYLTEEGKKAPFPMSKKQMGGVRKLKGAAIRVCEVPESRVLGVCEGVETAWAVATAYRYRINVWALINCGNMAIADIPAGMFDKVIIFADHDYLDEKKGYRPGKHYADQLYKALTERGIPCEIKIPQHEGTDFCDVWFDYYNMKSRTKPSFDDGKDRGHSTSTKKELYDPTLTPQLTELEPLLMAKWAEGAREVLYYRPQKRYDRNIQPK